MKTEDRGVRAYSVTEADREHDRDAVVALWRDHLAMPSLMAEKYQWFYRDAPDGKPALMFLHHGPDARPVGVAGVGSRAMYAHGKRILAGVLADFVVAPEHRTLYPALLLQQRLRQLTLPRHAVLYGTPNEKSLAIVRRLGYAHVGDLVRYVGVLRHQRYLTPKLPRLVAAVGGPVVDHVRRFFFRPHSLLLGSWRGEWITSVDARFDELWNRAKRFDGVIGVRDQKFLSWRFMSQPGHKYRIFVVSRSKAPDRICGYAVCEAAQHMLAVRDLLLDPAVDQEALRVLIHLLGRAAYSEGYVSFSFEIMGPQRLYDMLSTAGVVERDRVVLYAAFAPQHTRLKDAMWYATRADLDV